MNGIFGVTNREALDPRFKCIGKLRKGAPKKANQPGKDLEYFRFTSDNDAVVKAFRQIYSSEPDSFEVYFPYPTYEAVFPTARELYGQNHLLKEQCDGMHIIQWVDGYEMKRGKRLCDKPCKNVESRPPCPDCPLKPIGRLSVILIPLLEAGIVGTVTIETHGWHDVSHISNQLAMYEPLTGRAFRVYREKTRVGTPNKKTNKRMATDKWLVRIEPTQETAVLLIQDAQRRARQALLGEPVNVPQLKAGAIDFDNGDPDEYDETVIDAEAGEDEKEVGHEPDAPPADEKSAPVERPDFSTWKPGAKWTAFCILAAESFACLDNTNWAWQFVIDTHGNPPNATYDEAWTSCEDHDLAPTD